MAAPLGLLFATALWLCPLWFGPTPTVPPLLWGGLCLAVWLLLTPPHVAVSFDRPLALLLASLGVMVLLRSASLPNALAANLCLLAIGLSAYLSRTLARQGKTHGIAWAWLIAGLVNSGLALIQYAGWTNEHSGTAFGFLRQRNNMASLCMLAWVALLYLAGAKKIAFRWAVLVCGFLMTTLAATASRTGLLQLAVLSVLLMTLCFLTARPMAKMRAVILLCLLALMCYALAAWLLPQLNAATDTIAQRVMSTASSSTEGLQLHDSRKQLWGNTWDVAMEHRLFGVGWRELAYALHMTDFGAAERFAHQADNAHNLPLQFAAELGIPFAMLWLLGLAAYVCHKARRTWLARREAAQAGCMLGWGALIVLGIHSLLEYPLWYAPFQVALGLGWGLLTSRAHPVDDFDKLGTSGFPAHESATHNFAAVLGAALVIFCAYAAFDYHRVSQLFLSSDQRSSFYQTDTMTKAQGSWLFANQVRFAQLFAAPVTQDNALAIWQLGQHVVRFSPEPRVFKVLITAGEYLQASDADIAKQLIVFQRQLVLIER